MFKKVIFPLVVGAVLSGCATIFSGTTQNIQVTVLDQNTNTPIEGAACSITDAKGITAAVHGNPGSALVHKGHGVLTPRCVKAGYHQVNYGFGDSFNGVTLVNVLFWPGFIVDGMTGAMKEYPSHLTIYMSPNKK